MGGVTGTLPPLIVVFRIVSGRQESVLAQLEGYEESPDTRRMPKSGAAGSRLIANPLPSRTSSSVIVGTPRESLPLVSATVVRVTSVVRTIVSGPLPAAQSPPLVSRSSLALRTASPREHVPSPATIELSPPVTVMVAGATACGKRSRTISNA